MRTPLHPAHYHPRFGITDSHWATMLVYAVRERLFIFVRGGKEASIPWIELGYPAKPIALKTKVDPVKGLLVARGAENERKALAAGYRLMRRTDQGWRAFGSGDAAPVPLAVPVSDRWAEAGIVIDRASNAPVTSDYDLAAVIPSGDFDLGRDIGGYKAGENWTSTLAEKAMTDLNAAFGSRRFMHGPQSMLDVKLSNRGDESETIVAFCPNGESYWFATPLTEADAVVQFKELVVAIHPQAKHQFAH